MVFQELQEARSLKMLQKYGHHHAKGFVSLTLARFFTIFRI
jgi:hypothetical protein